MSYYAVEWRVFTPLTRQTIARVILRRIDGKDYYVALRDVDGREAMLGSWDALGSATSSVIAMYHQATGEPVYDDPDIDSRLRVYPQTPLPGAHIEAVDDGSKHAAVPTVHGKRR